MRIFWNYTKAFMGICYLILGLPLLLPITQQALMVPVALIGTICVSQYLLTSNIYFDEYDGEVIEKQ